MTKISFLTDTWTFFGEAKARLPVQRAGNFSIRLTNTRAEAIAEKSGTPDIAYCSHTSKLLIFFVYIERELEFEAVFITFKNCAIYVYRASCGGDIRLFATLKFEILNFPPSK